MHVLRDHEVVAVKQAFGIKIHISYRDYYRISGFAPIVEAYICANFNHCIAVNSGCIKKDKLILGVEFVNLRATYLRPSNITHRVRAHISMQ